MLRVQGFFRIVAAALLLPAVAAHAEGKLSVYDAWIRAAPPGTRTLAGYATLTNSGDAMVTILTVQSDAFRQSSIHETILDHGVAKMHELPRIDLAPGATIAMKPGGAHLMLTDARHPILVGDKVHMVFLLADGTRVETLFDVMKPEAGADEE
ncbi:MAG TPA: copper chaperone PCu(A)C [Rhodanobacteraceae bacterium]